MTSESDRVEYLRSLVSVRESSQRVFALAKNDALPSFRVDFAKIPDAADYVISVIRQAYPEDIASVPFHSRYYAVVACIAALVFDRVADSHMLSMAACRWRHFETGNPERVGKVSYCWFYMCMMMHDDAKLTILNTLFGESLDGCWLGLRCAGKGAPHDRLGACQRLA